MKLLPILILSILLSCDLHNTIVFMTSTKDLKEMITYYVNEGYKLYYSKNNKKDSTTYVIMKK